MIAMSTAIIILNYNDGERTSKLAQRIAPYKTIDHIILVDNDSADDSLVKMEAAKEAFPEKTDICRAKTNGGYARGNNFGIRYAIDRYQPDHIFVANPDVFFTEDVAARMIEVMDGREDCGLVAPVVKQGRNVWDLPGYAGIIESLFLISFNLRKRRIKNELMSSGISVCKAGVLEGSFFLLSRRAYEEAGGFDERTFLYAEETIMARRLLDSGYSEYVITDMTYDHLHSASIRKRYASSKARAFHHFRDSFRIYNKYYLHTGPVRDMIFDICWGLGYVERVIYDWVMRLAHR